MIKEIESLAEYNEVISGANVSRVVRGRSSRGAHHLPSLQAVEIGFWVRAFRNTSL